MASKRGRFGVLALQGAFAKHIEMLQKLEVEAVEIRTPKQLEQCDALIIPGGESTTIFRQIHFVEMAPSLREFFKIKPVFGTCAGLILMSKQVIGGTMEPFAALDVSVERNAFGRQAESFQTKVHFQPETGHGASISAIFIRAPRIKNVGPNVKVLAEYNGEPVLVQQGLHLGATFHPELTNDTTIHQYFIDRLPR